ncbi:MAG: hypothetical protein QXH07_06275 [Thermoplasmata archaeon]
MASDEPIVSRSGAFQNKLVLPAGYNWSGYIQNPGYPTSGPATIVAVIYTDQVLDPILLNNGDQLDILGGNYQEFDFQGYTLNITLIGSVLSPGERPIPRINYKPNTMSVGIITPVDQNGSVIVTENPHPGAIALAFVTSSTANTATQISTDGTFRREITFYASSANDATIYIGPSGQVVFPLEPGDSITVKCSLLDLWYAQSSQPSQTLYVIAGGTTGEM